MSLVNRAIVDAIRSARLNSNGFAKAVREYRHAMNVGCGEDSASAWMGFQAQVFLGERFGSSAEAFSELVIKFGPHFIVDLFWPSLGASLGWSEFPVSVPELVVDWVVDHIRSCPSCYECARARAAIQNADLAPLYRLMPGRGTAAPS
jgi:hypothetical protein